MNNGEENEADKLHKDPDNLSSEELNKKDEQGYRLNAGNKKN